MIVVGELKDRNLAEEIVSELNSRQIPAILNYIAEHEVYVILLPDESQLREAQEVFRVRLGFQKPIEIDEEWVKIKRLPRGQYTYAIIIVCILVFLFTYSDIGRAMIELLFIGKVDSPPFYEFIHGQFWRPLTPIFIHMGVIHILFNLMVFKDFGYLIENSFGKNFFLWFVIGTGLFSNIAQYLVGGPQFGGMSGVLYAMFGFIWVYKKCHPDFEYSLPKRDIGVMIGWYLLCLTGLIGNIANTAHGAGLVAGMSLASVMNFKGENVRIKYLALSLFFFIFTLAVEGYKLDGRYFLLLWMN